MTSKLEQLKSMTKVVADTGDLEAIKQWCPEDATTNPSLLLNAAESVQYQSLSKQALEWAKRCKNGETIVENACDYLAVAAGKEILDIIPGKVSTEVDARLSFDTQGTIDKAKKLIGLYEELNIDKNRVLIKIAATWEGIKAAEALEKMGINCNLTLIFNFEQAVACAEAGVFLISPFVGRILDWYKQNMRIEGYPPEEDPGVLSVTHIYKYFKNHNYPTVVMGASFRSTGQIQALAGCDRLTISPALLAELEKDNGSLARKLSPELESESDKLHISEQDFRWAINEDAMATEKLAQGIRQFAQDQVALEDKLSKLGS